MYSCGVVEGEEDHLAGGEEEEPGKEEVVDTAALGWPSHPFDGDAGELASRYLRGSQQNAE